MKLRKLVMCVLVGMALFGFTGVNALAEETTDNTSNTTVISDISVINTDSTLAEAVANAAQANEDAIIEDTAIEDTAKEDTDIEETEADVEEDTTEKTPTKKKTEKKYSQADLRVLSCLIFCEAGGETYNGKLAVAIVVVNRKISSAFPDTIKGVIYQRCQFGPARNGSLSNALRQYDAGKFTSDSEDACIKAAKAALSGTRFITVGGEEKNFSKFLYFSGWLKNATFRLGNHEFK